MLGRYGAVVVALGLGLLLVPVRHADAAWLPAQDATFLRAVHQANLAEISSGNLALRKAASDEVRRHARLFVNDHRRLDEDLRRTAGSVRLRLPAAMTPAQQEQVARLSRLAGPAFDAAWLQHQTRMHRECVQAARRELEAGSTPQVVGLARRMLPVVQAHLSILEETVGRRTPDAVEAGAGGQSAGEPARSAPLGLGLLGVAIVLGAGALLLAGRRSRA